MEASSLLTLNIDYGRWDPCAKFDYAKNAQAVADILQTMKLDPCDDLKDLRLSTRLGSSSTVGIVLKYAPPRNKEAIFAMKVIPGDMSNTMIRREIAISRYLSSLNVSYYPRFYGYGTCTHTIFPGASKAEPAVYLLYELLAVDLNQLLDQLPKTDMTQEALFDIIVNIFIALEDLQARLVLHPDTHPGNIMFRCTGPGKFEPVIIDFGSCQVAADIFKQFDPVPQTKITKSGFMGKPKPKVEATKQLLSSIQKASGYDFLLLALSATFVSLERKFPELSEALYYTSQAKIQDLFSDPKDYRLLFSKTFRDGVPTDIAKKINQVANS
jgi:serine/threonine protein kinase